jgi:tetratricopeptide (TPR) repeat protein
VGLLRARQKRYDCAIQSYLKALWVQTSSVDARDSLNIAITENRLGLAYGKCGDLLQAISLLEKTLEHYDKAKMKADHHCVVEAQTALLDFRSRHLQQSLSLAKHTPLLSMRRLGHIHEEREYQVEQRSTRW